MNFEDTEFLETDAENAEVTLWETPVHAKNVGEREGVYVLGADPAYGSSEWACEFAASMLRCYADRVVQALEVGSTAWTEQQFAWVLCISQVGMATVMLNLEMQGPGATVYNEIGNLKKLAGTMTPKDPRAGAFHVIGCIRDYLYTKQDSMNANYAYQWQTNPREKLRMMSTLRSYFERNAIEINSPLCLKQFRNIHRQGDQIGGEGRAKDDRVIALAIGVVAWNDWIMLQMQTLNRTWASENRPVEAAKIFTPVERSVINYLNQQGVKVRGVN